MSKGRGAKYITTLSYDETALFSQGKSSGIAVPEKNLIDWFFETVILSLLPLIVLSIINLFQYGKINLDSIIGGGELLLCAFIISLPSVVNFNIRKKNKEKLLFYIGSLVALFELIAYVAIKALQANVLGPVSTTSMICLGATLIVSCFCELRAKGIWS